MLQFYRLIAVSILLMSLYVYAQVPRTINFQGLLTDENGIIVQNGSYDITVKIYNTDAGGSPLWTETQSANIEEGIYNLILGSVNQINLPFDQQYWVGVTIGTGSELTPRLKLVSVPYSFNSYSVIDNSISTNKIQNNAVTSLKISDGTILANDIAANQLIKSVNGIKDSVTLVGSGNITITPNGSTITINGAAGGGGDITAVIAGNGLDGGGLTGDVTLNVEPGGITNLMLQDNSVTTTKIQDGTIATTDLANNSVTTSKIGDNSVTSAKVTDGNIATVDLQDGSVTGAKILDGTIVNADLSDNSVTTGKLADLTVGTIDLANNSVTTGKILDGTIIANDIAANQLIKSVNGIKDSVNFIAGSNVTITPSGNTITINSTAGGTGTVTQVNTGNGLTGGPITTTGTISIDNNGVTSTMILDGSIANGDLADNSVTNTKIADGTITTSDLLDGTVGTIDIANNSITTGKIEDATITGTDIANSTIGPEKLNFTPGTGTVTSVGTGSGLTGGPITTAGTISIATNGITSTMILDGTVLGTDIFDGTIATSDLANNSITTGKIVDATITAIDLATGSVTSDEILDGTIVTGDLADNSITTADILNGTLLATDIANTQVVKSLNTLTDNVNLVAGTNISITPSGNNLTISSTTGGIGGSGTINYLPKFTATTTLGNSIVFDNGTNVGIGTTNPQARFEVAGGNALVDFVTIGRGAGTHGWSTAIGMNALKNNLTGDENSAIGWCTLLLNESGSYNTAVGMGASYYSISGFYNTAIGWRALHNNTSSNNTAVGQRALFSNTTGSINVAVGGSAMQDNLIGYRNTAIGLNALDNNTTGFDNVCIGYYSGTTNLNVVGGTFIGTTSYSTVDNLTNVSGFGYNSRPTTSNQVRVGNSSVTSIGGYAGWTNLSDERYKLNVQENVKGLDFVMKLHPVSYQLNMNKLAADLKEDQRADADGNIINTPSEIDIQARIDKSQIVYTGFIAQEVEKAANELGFNFSGVDAPKNENDFYGLRYAEFVVPLVKAVQEQQVIINDQQRIIEDLKNRIEALELK